MRPEGLGSWLRCCRRRWQMFVVVKVSFNISGGFSLLFPSFSMLFFVSPVRNGGVEEDFLSLIFYSVLCLSREDWWG